LGEFVAEVVGGLLGHPDGGGVLADCEQGVGDRPEQLIETVGLASASIRLSEGYGFAFKPVLLLVIDDNAAVPARQIVSERLASIGTALSVGVLVVLLTVTAFQQLSPFELRQLLDARQPDLD
jgi:hypothetical protein